VIDARPPPAPGSAQELDAFRRLQRGLPALYRRIFADDRLPRTVVVVPSLTLDPDTLAKIDGVVHYEERMLCLLLLLRLPATQVVYVTSMPVDRAVVDYYLRLVGLPRARDRLVMLSLGDPSMRPLTAKVVTSPDGVERIRRAIAHPEAAHMTVFAATPLERTLAVRLGIPMYATDPEHARYGTKTGSREVMEEAGVRVPSGSSGLRDEHDVLEAVIELKTRLPLTRKVVVKLNEGFSGEGNATVDLTGASSSDDLRRWVRGRMAEEITFEAEGETWDRFRAKIREMGAIVEEYVDGPHKRSPSIQARIDPVGRPEIVSTHDQILGGPTGQVFLGCTFPADPAYVGEITEAGRRVAELLARRGVIGRFGVDFVSVRRSGRWHHYGLEINLRKGGTTSPYLLLQFLTGGSYDAESGRFVVEDAELVYRASDNVQRSEYRGITPGRLLAETAADQFRTTARGGIAFQLMGPLPSHGKVGMMAVAGDQGAARERFDRAVSVLDRVAATEG
jgi:hypothetical protein